MVWAARLSDGQANAQAAAYRDAAAECRRIVGHAAAIVGHAVETPRAVADNQESWAALPPVLRELAACLAGAAGGDRRGSARVPGQDDEGAES
jgi:hypothetical protein